MGRQPIGLHGPTHLPDGSDPIPASLVIVAGGVFNDGSVIEGTGFTVSDDGPVTSGGRTYEQYTVTFDTSFINPPVVELTPNNNNPTANGVYTVSLVSRTASAIVVATADVFDADLAHPDGGFDFIALEQLS